MRLAFTAVAVCFFAAGVLVRDVAQDYAPRSPEAVAREQACDNAKENAARWATALVHLLNQKPVELQGATISCRVRHSEEKS